MAKRFRFRLETLLRVRQLREDQAKRKVGAQRAEIARIDQVNRQTEQEIARYQLLLRENQQKTVLDPAALTSARAWIAHLRRTIVERQSVRAALVKDLQRLLDELRQAHTQTRVLEKLRERRWDAWIHERDRREQADADELARQLHSSPWLETRG